MQIWLIETWTGTPTNSAPEEHDVIGWFAGNELGELRLAHDSYLATFTKALAEQRA
jgi:hypothetical protein